MRKIDESERPMPEIDLAKVCFIIEKSREYLGEDVGVEADNSNPADDDEHVMLTDTAGRSIRRELIEFIKDLDVDEAAAVVALAWIGRDDMQPEEWKIAVAQAKERAEGPTWKYLLEMELLPDYLEDALSAFGRSCEGLGRRTRAELPGRESTDAISCQKQKSVLYMFLFDPLANLRRQALGGETETRRLARGELAARRKREKFFI